MLSQSCGITTLRERQASGKSLLCSKGIPPSRACGEKGRVEARAEAVDGITPACAGKRLSRGICDGPDRDHPRVCGEKPLAQEGGYLDVGSPPRVRGKVSSIGEICTPPGITPACAGKRPSWHHARRVREDHPRVCGEKSTGGMHMDVTSGSPPRVRGKDDGFQVVHVLLGITPTCAGKRSHRR